MARKLRVEYPGAIYHVMNRGDRREPIFRDDVDRQCFMKCLGEVCSRTGWQVHAYMLMENHFHLVVETAHGDLVTGMKWFLGTYTGRFNRRHKVFGHLFSGRYKALIVDGSGNGYLKTVCDYVHLNPVRAKLLERGKGLQSYVWSSWPAYLGTPSRRPKWLRVDRLMGEWAIPQDSAAGRRELEQQMELRRGSETKEDLKAIRRGWCLGSEEFRKELLAQMSERAGAAHYGPELGEAAEAKAERLVKEELRQAGWTEKELAKRSKGDETKVAIALRLREEATMTVAWIAQRLQMGSRDAVNNLLSQSRKRREKHNMRD